MRTTGDVSTDMTRSSIGKVSPGAGRRQLQVPRAGRRLPAGRPVSSSRPIGEASHASGSELGMDASAFDFPTASTGASSTFGVASECSSHSSALLDPTAGGIDWSQPISEQMLEVITEAIGRGGAKSAPPPCNLQSIQEDEDSLMGMD